MAITGVQILFGFLLGMAFTARYVTLGGFQLTMYTVSLLSTALATIVLIAHVLADNWATILPQSAAELFLSHGPLRAIPLTDPDAGHLVGLIAPAREPQMPIVAALLAEAKRVSR